MPKLKIPYDIYIYGRKPNCAHRLLVIDPIRGDDDDPDLI